MLRIKDAARLPGKFSTNIFRDTYKNSARRRHLHGWWLRRRVQCLSTIGGIVLLFISRNSLVETGYYTVSTEFCNFLLWYLFPILWAVEVPCSSYNDMSPVLLWSRLSAHYDPRRLIQCLLCGEYLTPITRSSTRYKLNVLTECSAS